MAQLTVNQIAELVAKHTRNREHIARAVAVAMAESGGRTDARNVNRDSSVDRGLWQINSRWHPGVTEGMADDPAAATAYAARISRGFADMGAWYGYTGGTYRRHLPQATVAADTVTRPGGLTQAVTSAGSAVVGGATAGIPGAVLGAAAGKVAGSPEALGSAVVGAGKGAVGAVVSTGEFLAKLSDRGTWVRVLYVVGGLACVTAGGLMLNRELVTKTVGAAADFVPAGRVAKAAAGVAKGAA